MRPEEQQYEDDFVVDDEEEPDWRQALKSITKYDPSKCFQAPLLPVSLFASDPFASCCMMDSCGGCCSMELCGVV